MNNKIEGSTGMTPVTIMTQSNDYGNDTLSISPYSQSPYNNSTMAEYGNGGGFIPQNLQAEPMASRMPPPQAQLQIHHEIIQPAPTPIAHHQLPMLNTTWTSQLRNPSPAGSYSAPPLILAPVSNPQQVETPRPQPAAPPPPPQEKARRTLSIEKKRAICLYYEENPLVKQGDIGVHFGVAKSTVSRILNEKEHYLKRGQEQKPYNFSDSSAGVKATTPSSDCATSKISRKPAPRLRLKRRGYTKSHRGCYNCKRSRIKCQETQPKCGHCVKKELQCEYPSLPQITHQPHNQIPIFSLQDVRPFQHSEASKSTNTVIPIEDADGRLLCPYCTNSYKNNKHLKRHLLCHTGHRPYMCVVCSDRFMRSDVLKRHFLKCSSRYGPPSNVSHLSHPGSRVKENIQQTLVLRNEESSQCCGLGPTQIETGELMANGTLTQSRMDFTLSNSTSPGRLWTNQQQFGTEWNGPCIDPDLI